MDYEQLRYDLRHAPAIKLLKRENAPLIISFLHRTFKRDQAVNIAQNELIERLESYLEQIHETHPNAYPLSAAAYLKQWSDEDHQVLRVIVRGNDDPLVELTVEAERVIAWIEERYRRSFVSTESRLRSIVRLLEEIVGLSTADVPTRLAQLEAERDALQQEIDTIRASGEVIPASSTAIKERFLLASDLARQMRRDFAEVEQNFRSIARTLQERQLQPEARKGELVGYMLDADAELRESDQGRSFYAFWEFLMSPSRQDALADLLQAIYQLPVLTETSRDQPLLRRLTRSLIDAGEKIVQSNYRLAEQVRRLLDERTLAESRRARELIVAIKQTALQVVEQPPADADFLELPGLPDVQLVMDRPLWEPRTPVQITTTPIAVGTSDLADPNLHLLYTQFAVDEQQLRRQIAALLDERPTCTLSELLQRYPAEQGLAELIGYLRIATSEPQHQIDPTYEEALDLPATADQAPRRVALPRVVFRSSYGRAEE